MAKIATNKKTIDHIKKKTIQAGKKSSTKMAGMNKSKKRSYKAYRGQGR